VARLLVGKIDKDSGPFLQILERVKEISEMPEDEGEGVTPLAIDIANILNKENSESRGYSLHAYQRAKVN